MRINGESIDREASLPTAPDIVSALPLHVQISEALIRDIAAGRLANGERLPPEREMARAHGTSLRTLRKALADLGEKGLIERRQGSGNYVRATPGQVADSVYSMFRLERIEGGGLPTAQVLEVTERRKDHDWGESARATRIRRLRLLSGRPAAVEEIWLDAGAGKVDPEGCRDSLYRHYRLALGFWIARAEDRVSVGPVPGWAPEAFGPRPGSLTGYIERYSWAQAAAPVEFSRTWYDPAAAVYVQRMI